jgi:hypothetical protein
MGMRENSPEKAYIKSDKSKKKGASIVMRNTNKEDRTLLFQVDIKIGQK